MWVGPTGKPTNGWFAAVHVVLMRTAQGPAVEHLQELLGIAVTGLFDEDTETAINALQAANARTVTGVCGPEEWALLHPTIRLDDRNSVVAEVQYELRMPNYDGTYDGMTSSLISRWQERNSLPSDDQFDRDDYRRLLNLE